MGDKRDEHQTNGSNRIMVVDDDRTIRELIERTLTRCGYHVFTAANGLKLVSVLKVHKPDLILLDIMMNWIDGYELCKIIKKVDEFKHIPVIFVSAKNQPEDIEYGYSCGAQDYITKPFDIQDLIQRVKKALDKASADSPPA